MVKHFQCRELESLPIAARGSLYGIPFAVKDNIDVAGLPTTASCEAYRYTPAESAPTVQALLDAGVPSLARCHYSLTGPSAWPMPGIPGGGSKVWYEAHTHTTVAALILQGSLQCIAHDD